jgi:hypothetical protein
MRHVGLLTGEFTDIRSGTAGFAVGRELYDGIGPFAAGPTNGCAVATNVLNVRKSKNRRWVRDGYRAAGESDSNRL